jgi:hypothetical protein
MSGIFLKIPLAEEQPPGHTPSMDVHVYLHGLAYPLLPLLHSRLRARGVVGSWDAPGTPKKSL